MNTVNKKNEGVEDLLDNYPPAIRQEMLWAENTVKESERLGVGLREYLADFTDTPGFVEGWNEGMRGNIENNVK